MVYTSSRRRPEDSLKDKKAAKSLYIFEKLFQKLEEGADSIKCVLQQYYIFQ